MKTIRVLIADDDGAIIETYKNWLTMDRDYRFIVEWETEADRIIEKVEWFKPDVVLLDNVFADGASGIDQVLPSLKAICPEVAVIIVTGKRGPDTRQIRKSIAWQASDFLDKGPLTAGFLIARIVEAYDRMRDATGADR